MDNYLDHIKDIDNPTLQSKRNQVNHALSNLLNYLNKDVSELTTKQRHALIKRVEKFQESLNNISIRKKKLCVECKKAFRLDDKKLCVLCSLKDKVVQGHCNNEEGMCL